TNARPVQMMVVCGSQARACDEDIGHDSEGVTYQSMNSKENTNARPAPIIEDCGSQARACDEDIGHDSEGVTYQSMNSKRKLRPRRGRISTNHISPIF